VVVVRGAPQRGAAAHAQCIVDHPSMHARVTPPPQAHAISLKRVETSMAKIGRLLDSTLNRLLWGSAATASGGGGGEGGSSNGAAGGSNNGVPGPAGDPSMFWLVLA
jgi:hypothetical protein